VRRSLRSLLPIVVVLVAFAGATGATRQVAARFDRSELRVDTIRSFDRLRWDGCVELASVGEPSLPAEVLHFVVPSGMTVRDVVVSSLEEQVLPERYRVLPAQPEVPIGEEPDWAEPDPSVYGSDRVYPSERVVFMGEGSLGGYRIATVAIYPLTYEPKSGRLTLATDVSVELVFGPGGDDSIPRHRVTRRSDDLYRRVVESLVANPEDVLTAQGAAEIVDDVGPEGFLPRHTPSLDGSPVEYVIVTDAEFESYFQTLADRKTKKGVPAVVKTIPWIEANYPGGCDTAERIRLFLQDAYSSWGTTYVLLGGDTDVVPIRTGYTTYYAGEEIPTDLYYSDLDGNWNGDGDATFGEGYVSTVAPGDSVDMLPDVFVGRAPVNSIVEVETFLDKCEAYETTTEAVFVERNLYLGEVLFPYDWEGGAYSLDGASDVIEPSLLYVPGDIHVSKLYANYDSFPESNPLNRTAALDSLDAGYHIVSHVGHANRDLLRASKGDYLMMPDIDGLTNGLSKGSFLWLLNCSSTAIDFDCIAETAVNNDEGGSVACFGPTRYAFPTTLRNYYWEWFDQLYNEDVREMGVLCAISKVEFATNGQSGFDNTNRWTQFSMVFLGDPELSLWTERPTSLSVAHPGSLQVGDSGMTVTVTDPSPVVGALVCVSGDNGVYAYDTTDGSGEVIFDFVPHETGLLSVTVSADNHLPSETTVDVLDASDAHIRIQSFAVNDDDSGASSGNSNGLAEASETIELDMTIENTGVASAAALTAVLRTSDVYVSLEDSTASFGALAIDGNDTEIEAFRFSIADSCPNEHDIPLTVEFTEASRLVWSEGFTVRAYAPILVPHYVSLDDSSGDGDGTPEIGETVSVTIEVMDDGNGDADLVSGVLRYAGAEVTVSDSSDSWGDIEAGAWVAGSGGFTFSVSDTIRGDFRLILQDGYGKMWEHFVDFFAPAKPLDLGGRVKGTTIQLSWSPVTDGDLEGYDVYRADVQVGPYVVANGGIVERVSYYADAGLDENSEYWYYVVAVDSSGNMSEPSDVLSISTNPPSQLGWPLATDGGVYASPLVADIDDDGMLDVVVASNHIFAWSMDGSEVLDGDGDPRTNGVFETDGTGGYRASPAIGEVDGDPGLEIVCPAWSNVGTVESPSYEIFAWNAEDGSIVTGWPVTTGSFCWGSPCLVDFDHDGRSEVLIPAADGFLYCWRYNGSEYIDGDDNPLTTGIFASLGNPWTYGSPAVADLDDDGEFEVVQCATDDSIYCFNHDGSDASGWPIYIGADSFCSPAIGDVDNDGALEIVLGSQSYDLLVLEADGTVMPNWPQTATQGGDFPPTPVLADLTGDGYLEIIQVGTNGRIDIWDYLAQPLVGWPKFLGVSTHCSPVVADIDGDPGLEIVVGESSGRLLCYNVDGSLLGGWPIQTDGEMFASPIVTDVDGDGDVEVIACSQDANVYIWDCDGDYADGENIEWGCFLHDPWRTQFYGFVVPVGVPEDDGELSLRRMVLEQNRPNPFNPVTSIAYEIPASTGDGATATLSIYSVDGSLVATLVDGDAEPGRNTVVWDGRDVRGRRAASGVYFYRLTFAGHTAEKKMVLLK